MGGTAPYAWSWNEGSVMAGLSLGTDGVISGTPSLSGSFSFNVRVTDAAGVSAQRLLTLSMVAPAEPLSIFTTALPSASMSRSYKASLNGGGGKSPYTWSLAGGQLPPGLTVTNLGRLKGTPMSNGTFSFSVRVTDAHGQTVEKLLSLHVGP